MEKAMPPHSSTLAWKIPWTEEPGRLQSMRSLRVEHDWSNLAAAAVTDQSWGQGWWDPGPCSPGESRAREKCQQALWPAQWVLPQRGILPNTAVTGRQLQAEGDDATHGDRGGLTAKSLVFLNFEFQNLASFGGCPGHTPWRHQSLRGAQD